jgi:hypothetical protein
LTSSTKLGSITSLGLAHGLTGRQREEDSAQQIALANAVRLA